MSLVILHLSDEERARLARLAGLRTGGRSEAQISLTAAELLRDALSSTLPQAEAIQRARRVALKS